MNFIVVIRVRKTVSEEEQAERIRQLSRKPDITEAERKRYIARLIENSKNAEKAIAAIMIVSIAFIAANLLCGRLLYAVVTGALLGYLYYFGKKYEWVFPIGKMLCGAASFMSVLKGIYALGFLPDGAASVVTAIAAASVPVDILTGVYFLYSKKIDAYVKYVEYVSLTEEMKEQ